METRKMAFLHHVNVPTVKATFGMGCFWGAEALFGGTKGVIRTKVGYTGGDKDCPTYRNLVDHTEAVEMEYDPNIISYEKLLDMFWKNHKPTALMKKQYASVIFYHNENQKELAEKTLKEQKDKARDKIQTTIVPAKTFYDAEDYHQKYRLQQHDYLMDVLKLDSSDLLKGSHVAARLNGYVAGAGGLVQLDEEAEKLGLTGKVLAYVREKAKKYEGCSVTCS